MAPELGPRSTLLVKTVDASIDIVTTFVPVPGLTAVGMLVKLIAQACQTITCNKYLIKQLVMRCEMLLTVLDNCDENMDDYEYEEEGEGGEEDPTKQELEQSAKIVHDEQDEDNWVRPTEEEEKPAEDQSTTTTATLVDDPPNDDNLNWVQSREETLVESPKQEKKFSKLRSFIKRSMTSLYKGKDTGDDDDDEETLSESPKQIFEEPEGVIVLDDGHMDNWTQRNGVWINPKKEGKGQHTEEAEQEIKETLEEILEEMKVYAAMSKFKQLMHADEIAEAAEKYQKLISDRISIFHVSKFLQHDVFLKWMQQRRELDAEEIKKALKNIESTQKDILILSGPNGNQGLLKEALELLTTQQLQTPSGRQTLHKQMYAASDKAHLPRPFELDPNPSIIVPDRTRDWQTNERKNTTVLKGRLLDTEDVAIKLIRKRLEPIRVQRFFREAEIWYDVAKADIVNKLPTVVPFYGICKTEDPVDSYLISPWMEHGQVLPYAMSQWRKMDYRVLILKMAAPILLMHTMADPIVHGDLRPENFLVTGSNGHVVLCSFASAQRMSGGTDYSNRPDIAGSRLCRYSAPEMFRGPIAPHPSQDIYMFAMCIYEMMCHERPLNHHAFQGRVVDAIMNDGERPQRPRNRDVVRRGFDQTLWDLLCACWQADPAARPDIHEVVQRLEAWHEYYVGLN